MWEHNIVYQEMKVYVFITQNKTHMYQPSAFHVTVMVKTAAVFAKLFTMYFVGKWSYPFKDLSKSASSLPHLLFALFSVWSNNGHHRKSTGYCKISETWKKYLSSRQPCSEQGSAVQIYKGIESSYRSFKYQIRNIVCSNLKYQIRIIVCRNFKYQIKYMHK